MEKKEQTSGHRQRLKDKFRRTSGEGLNDYELLELLLTYALPRRDVKPLAKELIARFDGLAGVLDATPEDLEKVKGMGMSPAGLIKLAKHLSEQYLAAGMRTRDALSSPQSVLAFARTKMAGLPNEAFLCIYLNTKNEVLRYRTINQGTVDKAAGYPRRIIEEAQPPQRALPALAGGPAADRLHRQRGQGAGHPGAGPSDRGPAGVLQFCRE